MKRSLLFLVLLLICHPFSSIAQTPPVHVPEDLQPWVDWVLHDQDNRLCSHAYKGNDRHCLWPSRLSLELTEKEGRFSQEWLLEKESWLILPGDEKQWPQNVMANEKEIPVVKRQGKPVLRLPAGSYSITGSFDWRKLPDSLAIPETTALIDLTLNSEKIPIPDIDRDRLWLGRKGAGQTEELKDRLSIRVYRHIEDSIPLRITTRIDLQVAGQAREVLLGWVMPENQIPLQLQSPLPARLEKDGRLHLQVKPGNWSIDLVSRCRGPVQRLVIGNIEGVWPEEEIWAFDARNHLRLVTVDGVAAIDPSQTTLPESWRNLPAYRMTPEDIMELKEKKRGDPEPEPNQLSLSRQIWLDGDGSGLTIQDHISGNMTSGWRLEMNAPQQLGRATVNGEDQLITRVAGSARDGVEVRQGRIELTAVSRSSEVNSIQAVGWNLDVKKLDAVLHLPPGWLLVHTQGVDHAPTWLAKWDLLDIFMVLIIFLATWKLLGPLKGGLGLITLVLICQDSGAPGTIWLALLAASALLRVLKSGRLAGMIRILHYVALAALVIIVIPYMVTEIRSGIYPQLERGPYARIQTLPAMAPPVMDMDKMEMETTARISGPLKKAMKMPGKMAGSLGVSSSPQKYRERKTFQYDSAAKIQTGPGLPRWSWEKLNLSWNGPVEAGQQLQLYLLSPRINLILAFVKTGLLALFVFFMFPIKKLAKSSTIAAVCLIGVTLSSLLPGNVQAGQFPSMEMLAELQKRLLAPDKCLPHCASLERMSIEIDDTLDISFTVHALQKVSIPLPQSQVWQPGQVSLNGMPAILFRDREEMIWLQVPAGLHLVDVSGPLPPRQTISLSLPLKPHRVEFAGKGWNIEGIDENNRSGNQLQLRKIIRQENQKPDLEPGTLPPLLKIERTLRLGLQWEIDTMVSRLSPPGSPILIEVPLLDGESITSSHLEVRNQKALVHMGPKQQRISYHSVFAEKEEFSLAAPATDDWLEIWRLDISPVWHLSMKGIPVIHHQGRSGFLQPEYHPWPGETVSFEVSRPQGVEGPTKTIEQSKLTLRPGLRATDAVLQCTVRSNRGDQQTLILPAGAELQTVSINGKIQPIRQQGDKVTLPIVPGSQNFELSWRQPTGISSVFTTPEVNLGLESVNSDVEIQLGQDRWVWGVGGPQVGPAILLYGEIFVILLVAFVLGRINLTPLKSFHWILLGLGLSQTGLEVSLMVVAWLLLLGLRQKQGEKVKGGLFNLMQIGLAGLSLAALAILFFAVQNGLLGHPDMAISGNGSSSYLLKWYQDRSSEILHRAWVFSLPILLYRLIMLAWALWLAFSLLKWLRWGWECFSQGLLWRKVEVKLPRRRVKKGSKETTEGRRKG